MRSLIDNPRVSLGAGVAIAVLVLVVWRVSTPTDATTILAFLVRWLHVLSAMVWIGLIFFVNFVQLVALQSADEPARGFLGRNVIPQVAWWFRHASTLAVATGAILLVTAGYVLPMLRFGTEVAISPARTWIFWSGVLGGLVMWMFVHMYIWPSLQVALGLRPGDADAKVRARSRVLLFARLNLVIAVPVTLAMLAAAHL